MPRELHVAVRAAVEGGFWGEVLELPGCYGCGETGEEVRADIRGSIILYLAAAAELTGVDPLTAAEPIQEVLRIPVPERD